MIKIYTNQVAGGWEPTDLVNGLGGSEEAVVCLAAELKRFYRCDVTVYHEQKYKEDKAIDGVVYLGRDKFSCNKDEILIMFKSFPLPVLGDFEARQVLHWSCEVTNPLDTGSLDYWVNVTDYHQSRHFWVPEEKSVVIPFGTGIESLESNRKEKEPNLMLYASSPDRGLFQLLEKWGAIKEKHPDLKLVVTYGFEVYDAMIDEYTGGIKQAFISLRKQLFSLMQQPDIEYVGHQKKNEIEQLYWKSQYWCLPLNLPDAELFCMNAVKSQYAGAIPVVNKVGALRNTVGKFIPFSSFAEGRTELMGSKAEVGAMNWSLIVANYWSKILNI